MSKCKYEDCGANRREFEDQSVIKGKFDQIRIRPLGLMILGEKSQIEKEC